MNPDIIFIDDPFDHTVCTDWQKENLRELLKSRVNPPKNSSDNRNDTAVTKTIE